MGPDPNDPNAAQDFAELMRQYMPFLDAAPDDAKARIVVMTDIEIALVHFREKVVPAFIPFPLDSFHGIFCDPGLLNSQPFQFLFQQLRHYLVVLL